MRIKKDHKNYLIGAVVAVLALAFVPAQWNPVNYIKDLIGGMNS